MEKGELLDNSNEDILGGIKSAISRGETLKQSMVALYNAGYEKSEIEDSARRYMLGKSEEKIYDVNYKKLKKDEKKEEAKVTEKKVDLVKEEKLNVKKEDLQKSEKQKVFEKQRFFESGNKEIKANQKFSDYNFSSKSSRKRKIEPITITLVLLLVLLIGILVSVFLFKEELVTFFNNLFG
ncbi:MAG: hypothetical protein WC812_03210 [Candidatus Pacearchaeota archaeon]|jgi:hypothetical protein